MIYVFIDNEQIFDIGSYALPVHRRLEQFNVSPKDIAHVIFRADLCNLLITNYANSSIGSVINLDDKQYVRKIFDEDEHFTAKEVSEVKFKLIRKLRSMLKPNDFIIFEGTRQLSDSFKQTANLYVDSLYSSIYFLFAQESYLDANQFKKISDAASKDLVTEMLNSIIQRTYQQRTFSSRGDSVPMEHYLKPGDGKKRKDEIIEYVIRNYHEAFAGYCNNRQIAEMLVERHGFKKISYKTISRRVEEIENRTGGRA